MIVSFEKKRKLNEIKVLSLFYAANGYSNRSINDVYSNVTKRMMLTNEIRKQFEEIFKVESLITSVDNRHHCLIFTRLTLTMRKVLQEKKKTSLISMYP